MSNILLLLPACTTRGTQQDCEEDHLSNQLSPVKGLSTHLLLRAATRCFLNCRSIGISCLLQLNFVTRLHSVG